MKNIYEDGADRQKIEEISSGDFDFSDADPIRKTPERPIPPKGKNAVSKKQPSEQNKSEKPKEQNDQQLPFALTQDQIAALLSQYFINQQSALSPNSEEESAQDETESLPKEQNPGTRILYQSPDFDKNDSLPAAVSEEERRSSFYDDDAFFEERQTKNRPPEIQQIETAPAYSGYDFSVDDVDVLPAKTPAGKTKPIIYSSAAGVGAVRAKNGPARLPDGFKLEEVDEPDKRGKKKPLPHSKKKKDSDAKNIIRIVILTVSILTIIISGAVLLKEYKLHKDNQEFEDEISGMILEEPTKKGNSKKARKEQQLSIEQQWAQIRAEYPNTIFPTNMQLKYAKLYATNNDFVGYLEAQGVHLSLPIVQTGDNSTYLAKNFYGASTKYGCPFVDTSNNIIDFDRNTILWGHHMNDGTVFGALDAYKSIEGFRKAPVITFNTLYQDYKWKVIAAFITNAYPEDDNGYVFEYYFTSLASDENYAAYLNELAQRSLYDTGVDVLPTDKLLTLSTCSHEFDEARFVVVARLVRAGESEDVDVSAAAVNPNPRYPQAYYTKKKLANPYANSPLWVIG